MATYTWANVDKWVLKSTRLMEVVMRQAINDLLNDIEIVPGINRGGSRVRGTIPRDLGFLAASFQAELFGSSSITSSGEGAWTGVVASLKAGDVVRFSWGGPGAPYARYVYYGANGIQGTYWIEENTINWQTYVSNAIAKVKARARP